MSETFTLPDGRITKSSRRYVREWRKFNGVLARAFPGYRASSFDPGVHMTALRQWPLDIEIKVARKIVALQLELEKMRRKAKWARDGSAWTDEEQQAGRHLAVP